MKKLLAILLVAVMFCSCFAVHADAVGSGTHHVIGQQGASDSLDNGVVSFTDKETSADIILNLSGVTSRYAVDITFGTLEFTFGGKREWDVNKLDYVEVETMTNPNVSVTVGVTNYSDKDVYTKVAPKFVDKLNDPSDDITDISTLAYWGVTAADGKGTIQDHTFYGTVKSVLDGTRGAKTDECTLAMTLNSGVTWSQVSDVLQDHDTAGTHKIVLGTIIVTVSQNPIIPPSSASN